MRYRKLGRSEVEASVIGLATWIGEKGMTDSPDERELVDTIRTGLDEGINFIDTAPVYGLGLAEELVGKAVEGRRDRVVLSTKCGLVWDTDQGKHIFDEHGKAVNRHLGAEFIRLELEQSLRRLKTDRVDLYQIHVNDPDRPMEEPMETLMALKKEGKIRSLGVCNVNLGQLQTYHAAGDLDALQ